MNELLGTNPTNIVINQYPNPLTKMKSENALELCENEDHTDTPNEWRATHLALPTKTAWQINLTKSESLDVQEHDITPLNTEIDAAVDRLNALSKAPLKKRTSQNLQWTTAPLKDVMREHGWCVDRATRMDPLSTPAHEWKPYATTGRFIRTANDSLLTQWPSDERERDRQNGFNGTFHPNAYGYAAMAEEVLKVIPSQ